MFASSESVGAVLLFVFGCAALLAGLGATIWSIWHRAQGDTDATAVLVFAVIVTIGGGAMARLGSHGGGIDYSDGVRVGYVTKISKKGLLWPTWEGEMQVGGLTTEGGTFAASSWEFSVASEQTAKAIESAMLSGKRVKLTYQEFVLRGISLGSTGYDVRSIEVAQ